MKLHESSENYLENILILYERNGSVRSVDLANEMGFSKPSVSRAVHLLEDTGYITIENNGELTLTDKGLDTAKHIYERHLFLSNYFVNLGVDEATATEDACRVEHYLSEKTYQALKKQNGRYCMDCPLVQSPHAIFEYNKQLLSQDLNNENE